MVEKNRIQGMVRSMDQWRKMVPVQVAAGSVAQVEYALVDAKHDIETLWRKLESLSDAVAEREAEPVAWRWKPKDSETWIYDPKHEWLEAQSRDEIDAEPLYLDPPPTSELEAEIARLKAELDCALIREGNEKHHAKIAHQNMNAEINARERTEARLAEAMKALEEAREVVDACAGDNRPARAWAVTVRDGIDAVFADHSAREGGKADG